MRRRVAVTGMGALTPLGNSAPAYWEALVAGRSGIRQHREPDIPDPVGWVDLDFAQVFSRMQLATLDRVSQMALVAAAEAMESSGLAPHMAPRHCGVFFGATMGGAESLEAGYAKYFGMPARTKKLLTVVAAMSAAPGSMIGIRWGVRGECQTYSTGCSSSGVAIGEAYRRIRDGYLEYAIAGGSDSMLQPGVLNSWGALKVLCTDPAGEPGTGCRPFSKDRTGFAMGEGAGILVLEDWDHALRRGAQPLCEIVGYGVSNDASHLTNPSAEGQADAMQMSLDDAGIHADAIDHVNAHGTATKVGDEVEALSMSKVLGTRSRTIPVSATKSAHGHLMGATSVVEMIASVMALRHQIVPPTTHWRELDEACVLDCVPGRGRPAALEHVLCNSFAFGGNNVSLVLRRASLP